MKAIKKQSTVDYLIVTQETPICEVFNFLGENLGDSDVDIKDILKDRTTGVLAIVKDVDGESYVYNIESFNKMFEPISCNS
jgi:hypothetical protein